MLKSHGMDETNQWKLNRSLNITEAPPRTSSAVYIARSPTSYLKIL